MTLALAVVHVVVWHSYRAEEQKAFERAAAVYTSAHPDVSMEPVAIPYDAFRAKLEAAIPHGNGPDLFVGKNDDVGEFARAGLIVPVGEVDRGQFLDGTLPPLETDGKLWGLPLAFKSLVLYWRTDRLDRPPASTDELFALAKTLRPRWPLVYESGAMFYHAAFVQAFGGTILDGNGRPALDSPEGVRALEFVLKLQAILPDEATNTVAAQLFNDGQAASTINGPWFAGEIAPGVPWKVAPLPIVSPAGRRMRPLVTVEGLFLPARARQPEAALAFARWLATDGALERALDGKQTVAARAAWDDPRVQHDEFLQAFRAQLADTEPMPNRPEMRAVWEPAQQALRKTLRGAADPRSALAAAEREVLEALRPPPPAVPSLPWALAGCTIALFALVSAWRRLKRRGGLQAISRHRWAYAYLLPAALAMAVLVFVPFAVGAAMSLFHYEPAGGGRWIFVGLRNFGDILASREGPVFAPLSFYYTLAVTALWTIANITLHVFIGVTLALLLRDPLLKLRGIYRMLLIVPWAVPNYITALIWKGMFHRQFGAVNGLLVALGAEPVSWFSRFWTAFAANLTTNVWLGFPFMMVVTLGALSRIPRELEEAAALDGASRWQRLRHVTLPLLWPALIPSVLLGAVWTFNMFNIVFLVSGGEPDGATEILVSQAYRWAFTRGHRYGCAAAYAVLIFIVLAVQSALFKQKSEEARA